MTVIWLNDDDNAHSITTYSNSTYSPPQGFSSDLLPVNGGSFIFSFNQPGKYLYGDPQFNSSKLAIVNVGTAPV